MAQDIRTLVLSLMHKKIDLENKIKEKGEILNKNGVGMEDALVDAEGYPLAHINVYEVRHARRDIIMMQNDYKQLMKQIEVGLGQYYHTRTNIPPSHFNPVEETPETINNLPFAKVTTVYDFSPALEAGLLVGDLILKFGSVNCDNFKDISSIVNVVKHSVEQEISVHVLRGTNRYDLNLRPHSWGGQGFLGCNIVALEFIDR